MDTNHIWDRAWEMVATREVSADSLFVYGVRTTGIYCRPSCPSRRPRRSSVAFFATSELAEQAGFRACKRCTPEREHPHLRVLTTLCRYLDQHAEQSVSLAALGKVAGLSPFHLQRLFRRCLGLSPRQYQLARRMEQMREGLATGGSVTEAIYSAGYSSSSRFYERATAGLGMKPGALRRGAAGETIRYTITLSPLGKMLVAATEAGLCAVGFGALESELEDDLRARFPRAELTRDDKALGEMVAEVLAHLGEHPVTRELPLDVRATAFQARVWKALQQIPRGETRSYAQVADAIGQPTAVRAVARACGSNPVAVVVPCHRVVGSDGSLTGYRWGIERKRKLLEAERKRS